MGFELGSHRWLTATERARSRRISPYCLVLAAVGEVIALWNRNSDFAVGLVLDPRRPDKPRLTDEADAGVSVTEVSLRHPVEVDFAARATGLEAGLVLVQNSSRRAASNGVSPVGGGELPVAFASRLSGAPPVLAGEGLSANEQSSAERQASGAHELLFKADEVAGELVVEIEYVSGRYAEGVVVELSASLLRLLEDLSMTDVAWNRTRMDNSLRLLPPQQVHRREISNATGGPVPEELLFTGFLRQVASRSDLPAIIAPDRTLSYRELYGYACALSHTLHSHGLGANQLAAIVMPKGWEQVAAAIGIELAGGAYLPVDCDLPPERIRFLIEHGETRAVVTTAKHRISWDAPVDRLVIELDQIEPAAIDQPPPAVVVRPEDLAYVIFTSGSTGMPKGVMIDHRGAWNTVVDVNERFQVSSADRVLALSRLSFDLSVYDIFGLLAAGGTIVLPDPELASDPAHWADLVRRHGVTIWNTVPALMQLFVDHASRDLKAADASLRLVMMSGDWIPLSLPKQIRELIPDGEIISLGGATEASIWSILYPIRQIDPAWKSVPYGHPMRNQTFHVLHPDLTPCPDHVIGELYIGGIGLAQGYWKDPGKTALRFITHPVTGERLYRTGDLGRYFPDGEIEFLGREDFQVKIHGYRIELGEIESQLAAHPDVRRAVVIASGDTDAGRRLVAYVVSVDESSRNESRLRDYLGGRIAEYMVPAAFVFLDELPLTANGKVDLKALPAPRPDVEADGVVHEPPATQIEEIVFALWQQVLPAGRFGIHHEFASLGGNSLVGTRLILRLREAFELEVPVRFIFEHPTVARMAAALEQLLLADLDHESTAA